MAPVNVCWIVVVCLTIYLGTGKADETSETKPLFTPKDCDREEWMQNQGCDKNLAYVRKQKCKELRRMLAEDSASVLSETDSSVDTDIACIEDLMLDDTQIDSLLVQLIQRLEDGKRRKKRKIRNFEDFPIAKWPNTIHYKIDGALTSRHAGYIRDGVDLWARATCLKFEELDINEEFKEQHILFTRTSFGCLSYIGRSSLTIPQPILLSVSCFVSEQAGYVAHELGHTIGLFHEHQRPDRDDYIRILHENIRKGAEGNFGPIYINFIQDRGVPYDYASIMHYRAQAFSEYRGRKTIETLDPLNQRTLGQRVELSFADVKIVNLAYCSDVCESVLPQPCLRHGYQDPMDCSRCRCPDGWTGTYCERVASPKGETCGGQLLACDDAARIMSPNYGPEHGSFYPAGQECSWWIKAPPGKNVVLSFEGQFGVYYALEKCFNWVEVRYKTDLGLTGARFCGIERPTAVLRSETDEALVIFKAPDVGRLLPKEKLGFKMVVVCDGDECASNPCQNGGACIDGLNLFTCVCSPEYTGDLCENTVLPPDGIECASNPCLNGGVCVEGVRQYSCECSPNYRGDTCEQVRFTIPAKADVVFLLDNSYRQYKGWDAMKSFTNDYIQRMDLRENFSRAGVITFDDYAYMYSALTGEVNRAGLQAAITRLRLKPGNANVYKALWLLQHEMVRVYNGARDEAVKIGIVITDSPFPPYFPRSIIDHGARNVHLAGIQLYVMGVGRRAVAEQLRGLTEDDSHFKRVEEYEELTEEETVDEVKKAVDDIVDEKWQQMMQMRQDTGATPFSTTEQTASTTAKPTTTTVTSPSTSTTATTSTTTTSTTSPTTSTTSPTTSTTSPTTSTTSPTTTTTRSPTTTTTSPTTTTTSPTTTTTSPTTTTTSTTSTTTPTTTTSTTTSTTPSTTSKTTSPTSGVTKTVTARTRPISISAHSTNTPTSVTIPNSISLSSREYKTLVNTETQTPPMSILTTIILSQASSQSTSSGLSSTTVSSLSATTNTHTPRASINTNSGLTSSISGLTTRLPTTTTLITTTTSVPTTTTAPRSCLWTMSDCSQPCGGCGKRTYERVCHDGLGQVEKIFSFDVYCNRQGCVSKCWIYIARLYEVPCPRPVCCAGFEEAYGICMKVVN